MKRFVIIIFSLIINVLVQAQGFPKAEKQPRMKEQKANQRKYARRAHRKHVKRGTAYIEPGHLNNQATPVCILTNSKPDKNIA